MGTEVQSKMHIPGYYSLRNLNENNSSFSWSLSQPNNVFGHFDFISTRPTRDANEIYHKEQLRQTILKHESVFRHQLCELHRLYRIQREMMNEMTSKESHLNVKPGTKTQRKLFDLELPADVYVNDEEPSQNGNLTVRYGVYSSNINSYASLMHLNFGMTKTNGSSNSNEPTRKVDEVSFPGSQFSTTKFTEDNPAKTHIHLETERRENRWFGDNVKPGQIGGNKSFFTTNFHLEDLRTTSKLHQADQNKKEPQTTKKIFGVEICERNHKTTNSDSLTISPKKIYENDAILPDPNVGLPWLKPVHVCNNIAKSPEENRQVSSQQRADESEMMRKPSRSSIQDLTPITCAVDDELSKQKASECSNKPHIDLNLSFVEEEVPMEKFVSSKIELKTTVEIDLEKPVIDPAESVDVEQDELTDAAAALVAISSSCGDLDPVDATCLGSEGSRGNYLHWFAEIVSSYEGNTDNEAELIVLPEEIDYFEFMTLNLTETKTEEYHYKPKVLESPKMEPELQNRPRRGQARRGRQRKDFQRDVLPTVASLLKNEVIEDLEMIEGLIIASGASWQSGFSLRHRTRSCGAKGRRRACANHSPPHDVAAICAPQSRPSNCREVAIEDKSLLGWGKRTRRLPRQRCSINNPSLPIK